MGRAHGSDDSNMGREKVGELRDFAKLVSTKLQHRKALIVGQAGERDRQAEQRVEALAAAEGRRGGPEHGGDGAHGRGFADAASDGDDGGANGAQAGRCPALQQRGWVGTLHDGDGRAGRGPGAQHARRASLDGGGDVLVAVGAWRAQGHKQLAGPREPRVVGDVGEGGGARRAVEPPTGCQ